MKTKKNFLTKALTQIKPRAGGGLKSVQKTVLAALLALAIAPVHAAVTVWDWGGYVATTDSPVIGGALVDTYCASNSGWPNYTCTANYTSVRGFGIIAYTGTPTYGVAVGGGTNRYKGLNPTCPENTAMIEMNTGYKRTDTGAVWNGLYDPLVPGSYSTGGWTYLGTNGLTSYVCVKTDTY